MTLVKHVKDLMRKEFTSRGSFDARKLRMSNIGKTDRFLEPLQQCRAKGEDAATHPCEVYVRSFD